MKKTLITGLLIVCSIAFSKAQQKPNIILVVADDFGWTDLQCYGSTFYESPNIDRLAASGMKFTNAYAACTVCSPSRAALMTGKYPARLHLTDWISGHKKPYAKLLPPNWNMYLSLKETTIAELLKSSGYTTASMGKWHLGDDEKYYPEHQGFDINVGGYYKGSPTSYFSPYHNPKLSDGEPGEQLTDRLTDEAVKFIRSKKEKPFFLYLPFYAVHTPIKAKPEDLNYFKGRIDTSARQQNPVYAGLIKNMDRNVGKLMDCLKQLNLTKNTLVIFTSDNGGLIGNRHDKRKQVTSNYPLRDGKGSAYEGGVRIPAIFCWDGKISPGVSEVPIISMDMYNTIAAAAGIKADHVPANDGVNLFPLLTAHKPLENRNLYWHYPHYHNQGATPYTAMLEGTKKLIYFYETGKKEMYDLSNDIGEQHDLSVTHAKEAERMYKTMQQWLKNTGAQFPVANPAYDEKRKNEKGPYHEPKNE